MTATRTVRCVVCRRAATVAGSDRLALPSGWGYRWCGNQALPVCPRCYYGAQSTSPVGWGEERTPTSSAAARWGSFVTPTDPLRTPNP